MSHSKEGSVKVIVFALAANLGIALSKGAGAFFSGSASLFAECIHSFVDCSNQVLLLIGGKKSLKPPTQKHPLGFGREAFFWSFLVALLLFSLGGLFAVYEGVHKLNHPAHEIQYVGLSFAILLFGFILESFSFHACLKEIKKINQHGSLLTWFRKTTASEILVIFTEDLAALLGLLIAMIFLGLTWIAQNSVFDAIGSIAVGALLCVVAVFLGVEIKSLIIGEAPQVDYINTLSQIWQKNSGTGNVLKLIPLQTGASEVLIACKLTPGNIESASELIRLINETEAEFKRAFPEVRWLFVEPDTKD